MRVRVYRNLTKKCISVQSTKTNLVIMHSDAVSLRDCKFIIRKGGGEKKNDIRAFIVGEIDDVYNPPDGVNRLGVRQANFNPKKFDCFYDVLTQERIMRASQVWALSDGTIFYK